MPTFLGLAVSIHADSNPLPEYSIQKQSKYHRITSYIPVPPAKIPPGATKPEQSSFAISITLLTPGLHVPYSTPKPTEDDPNPKAKIVGGLPGQTGERGKYGPTIAPYKPLTTSPNETIAAYIYFDGRAKEEVATLLRRGEETWVNSRWVSVPESEGGGLAEREFLFREVGLERWLNGLDLEGKDKDVAAKLERRRQRLEKKRAKRREAMNSSDEEDTKVSSNGVLRYSESKDAPVETLSGNDEFFTTDSDSDDEPPMPEAAGQIKVALFRVLASGEIKRGEYSPHFAKPKTLDPKSISTQTVTGIDPPDKPYAVFTFLYRGERQLRKMGILNTKEPPKITSPTTKRKSGTLDFGSLKPLNAAAGTKNFGGYRETSPKSKLKKEDAMDNPCNANNTQLKRQHSAEPLGRPGGPSTDMSPLSTPGLDATSAAEASSSAAPNTTELNDTSSIASPFKKQRASLPGFDDSVRRSLGQAIMGAQKEHRGNSESHIPTIETKMEEDEEL
ncbi:hypothetical protein Ptr902_10377 [Pyrenophora tritici-repentis]|nr:hypothetical protein Alg130_07028 [Pyrenophora tritici-repentis]KAI0608277.1 hypothetical protein TUN205_07490 [Pyrenophora tritici-repentis]KAI0621557.1 hypothetical protein TUN199_06435 [Pyrenophora tritici-repentis]KAI2478182.1 hypothetical protein Ptr902_10377 [Pyrenophora tritici-repentis]PWO24722.1 PEX11 domain containing protein [Pyrenophora tritici-repentis]